MSNVKNNATTYGAIMTPEGVSKLISTVAHNNLDLVKHGYDKAPVCVWGQHGIGKTAIAEQLKKDGWDVKYIALAQLVEMGDLLGMPYMDNNKTKYADSVLLPDSTTLDKGVLILDDFNRANPNISQGIMQLLQKGIVADYRLPINYTIVLTANPSGTDYAVEELDAAKITRMIHVTMEFDAKNWCAWATEEGIDERGVAWVGENHSLIATEANQRTVPRSIEMMLRQLAYIKNWNDPVAYAIIEGCLDKTVATQFITWVNRGMEKLILIKDILDAKDFNAEVYVPVKNMITIPTGQDNNGSTQYTTRTDYIGMLLTRMVSTLARSYTKKNDKGETVSTLTDVQFANLVSFLTMDFIPNDMVTNYQKQMETREDTKCFFDLLLKNLTYQKHQLKIHMTKK